MLLLGPLPSRVPRARQPSRWAEQRERGSRGPPCGGAWQLSGVAVWLPPGWVVGEQRSGPPPPGEADPAVTMETNEVVTAGRGVGVGGKWVRRQEVDPTASWASRPPLWGVECLQACLSRPGCLRNFRVSSVPDALLCSGGWGSSGGRRLSPGEASLSQREPVEMTDILSLLE